MINSNVQRDGRLSLCGHGLTQFLVTVMTNYKKKNHYSEQTTTDDKTICALNGVRPIISYAESFVIISKT